MKLHEMVMENYLKEVKNDLGGNRNNGRICLDFLEFFKGNQ